MSWEQLSLDVTVWWLLLLLGAIPLVVIGTVYMERRRRQQRLARYAVPAALPRLGSQPASGGGRVVRLGLASLCCAVALAGPRWGVLASEEVSRGIDMAIALDASLSMMAQDERTSRLERMKQEVRRLRAQSRADRIALLAFAGRSYILSPLTTDDGALELYLDNLTPDVVGQAGSSLAKAIRQGTELLAASTGTSDRALIVMSDGEAFDTSDEVRAAAAEAREQGVFLITVGFGTPEGATIPERVGNSVREKRDENGAVVVTKYSAELLSVAADAAEGVFVPAEATDRAGRVRAALSTLRTERRALTSRDDHVARFSWFVVPALILLLLDTWLADRRRTGRSRAVRTTGGTAVGATVGAASMAARPIALLLATSLSLLACTRGPDPAQLFADGDIAGALRGYQDAVVRGDTSAMTRYNLATVLLASDSLVSAAELLDGVRRGTDGELRARARYNAGLAQLLLARGANGDTANTAFAAARELLRAYLGERYEDEDAKWNYELALRVQPPSGGGGGESPNAQDQPSQPTPESGQLDQSQAEALLNAAGRDERDVQGRRQKMTRIPPPPGGRDW